MLRQGTGKDQTCIHLDYGPHGGAHGHFDKLGIIVFMNERIVAPDPARLAYSVPMHKTWYKTSLAHNTLVVDGQNQRGTSGTLDYFKSIQGICVTQARCDTAYDGVEMVRTIAVNENYVLDLFSVQSDSEHVYDLVYHLYGETDAASFQSATSTSSLTGKDGYQHLKDIRFGSIGKEWAIDYRNGENRVRQTTVAAEKSSIFTAEGLSDNPPRRCPATIVRTKAKAAQYATLLQPVVREPATLRLSVKGRGPVEVTVSGKAFLDRYILDPGKREETGVTYMRMSNQ